MCEINQLCKYGKMFEDTIKNSSDAELELALKPFWQLRNTSKFQNCENILSELDWYHDVYGYWQQNPGKPQPPQAIETNTKTYKETLK